MEQIKIPDGYQSSLNLHDTQIAIKTVKDFFQQTLAQKLNLLRVSAPVFVNPSSGLNDNLNGVERPVSFDIKGQPENAEIVHSLAKWKRYALQKYGFAHGEGLYTDMIAIRRDEDLDNIHSVYVDQWDWEKIIFIDECWALIGGSANRLAANFVLEIAKIIRGYGGSAVFATQDLNDFFALDDGKYGKGIINNCKTKIVLNLEDEEAQRVQSILHLSEAEVMEITHFERGNGLISTNNNNITVEFRCSDLEKSLITTDRRELQELVEQKKR